MFPIVASAANSVVFGRGVSNSDAQALGCEDDLGMACWYYWDIHASTTISGPPIRGRVRALALQHTDATSKFVRSVEFFVLAPIPKSSPHFSAGARYYILEMSSRREGTKYCIRRDPQELDVPVEKSQVAIDAHGQFCFDRKLLTRER